MSVLLITYKGIAMKFLDKIAMNRLIKIISDFLLKIVELFQPKQDTKVDVKPDRTPILPWRRKKKTNEDNN